MQVCGMGKPRPPPRAIIFDTSRYIPIADNHGVRAAVKTKRVYPPKKLPLVATIAPCLPVY
jgi:hypothetical protein